MSDEQGPYRIFTLSRDEVSLVFALAMLYAVTFAVLWTYGNWPQFALTVFLSIASIWLSVHDLQTFELPDIGTLAFALTGLAHVAFMVPQALLTHIVTAAGVAAFFWLLGEVFYRRIGQEGLGIGDAKLFGAGALLLGPWQLPELILLPSLGGIAFHFICRLRGQKINPGIPFGPFIAYAIFTLSFFDPIFL